MRLEGKVAVVTGGGDGMGAELVSQLLEQNLSVAFCDISREGIERTMSSCEAIAKRSGTKVKGYLVDVSSSERMHWFAEQVLDDFDQKVHLVFANAGITQPGDLIADEDWDEEQRQKRMQGFDRCFDIDYFGVLYTVRAFLPHVIKMDEGGIYITSSVNGFWTWPGHAPYTSAKFAVRGLAESLLVETYIKAPHIKVAVIHPGAIQTGIVRNAARESSIKDVDLSKLNESFTKFGISAADAAKWILDGVKNEDTRILVGYDAIMLDKMSRLGPHRSYQLFKALGREGITTFDFLDLGKFLDQVGKITPLGWARIFLNGGGYILFFVIPAEIMTKIWTMSGITAKQLFLGLLLFAITSKRIARM